jgi:acetyl esterase
MTPWFTAWPSDATTGVDPRVRAALETQGPVPEYRSLEIGALRATFAEQAARVPKLNDPVARVEDRTIGAVPIRIYSPGGSAPFPALVFLHGGGWVVGDLETHDQVCRSIASRGEAVVVAVHYRLAPETPFPGALEDGAAAIRWTAEHARELGVDPKRICVGGDSAGGNLAAVVALISRDRGGPRLCHQLLIYPVTDHSFETPSYRENQSGPLLTRDAMRAFWNLYLAREQDGANPYASPLRAPDLRGLPPAHVMTAEYDPLRDEGEAYARRLEAAGVPVVVRRYEGMIHGFFGFSEAIDRARGAVDDAVRELRRGFAAG